MTFASITVMVFLSLIILGSIVGACYIIVTRPPALAPAEYNKQINKMNADRMSQIEAATSPEELDDIDSRWNEAMSQIRRA